MDGIEEIKIRNQAYHEVTKRMSEQSVTPPTDLTSDQLLYWLLGYTAHYDAMSEIVRQLRERNSNAQTHESKD